MPLLRSLQICAHPIEIWRCWLRIVRLRYKYIYLIGFSCGDRNEDKRWALIKEYETQSPLKYGVVLVVNHLLVWSIMFVFVEYTLELTIKFLYFLISFCLHSIFAGMWENVSSLNFKTKYLVLLNRSFHKNCVWRGWNYDVLSRDQLESPRQCLAIFLRRSDRKLELFSVRWRKFRGVKDEKYEYHYAMKATNYFF
jgi:hypothetical protein